MAKKTSPGPPNLPRGLVTQQGPTNLPPPLPGARRQQPQPPKDVLQSQAGPLPPPIFGDTNAPTQGRVDLGPLTGQPRPLAPDIPTTNPTVGPVAPTRDPRIDDLLRELMRNTNGPQTTGGPQQPLRTLDLSGVERQSGQLRSLLAQLMRGEGINIGDVSNDPEAQAFAVQRRRDEEREREAAAAEAAVNPGSLGGDFEARKAQIREAAGTDIASQRAGLVGRRRDQALNTAMTGAQMQLADLSRQADLKKSEFGGYLEGERLRRASEQSALEAQRSATESQRANQQRMLEFLTNEDRYKQERFDRERDTARSDAERQLKEQLLRDEVERSKRALGTQRRTGPSGGSRLNF